MRAVLLLMAALMLAGCAGHKVTGYNLKGSVGNTSYDDGRNAFFTGGSVDVHVDVK